MSGLSGVFPVLPTPFAANGAVDPAVFATLIDWALAAGANGLVFPGMASEVETLTADERGSLVKLCGSRIAGRVPFIVGASDADPEKAATRANEGFACGASAAMVMAPASLGRDIDKQKAYYAAVAARAKLPLMLQNAPAPNGAGLLPEEVAAIAAAVPAIRFVKEETLPCGQNVMRIKAAAPASVEAVFGGAGARFIIDELARGAAGTMPALELADLHVALFRAWRSGDKARARRLYSASLPLLTFQMVFRVRATKEVLRLRGIIAQTGARAQGPKFDAGDIEEIAALYGEIAPLLEELEEEGAGMSRAVDAIVKVESFIVSIPRDVPYLGPLREGESVNARGYIVRKGNRTIYPTSDMSVIVKITGESGTVGWGETYGIVAPEAVTAIIADVLGPVMVGRDPADAAVIHEDLYDLMRVRGHGGGYYGDALAGCDIAVWDLYGKAAGLPVSALLGGRRHDKISAYASGLPGSTLSERCDLAVRFVREGVTAIKFAGVVSDGVVAEFAALREAVGPDVALMVDLHWHYTASEALELIHRLLPYRPAFVEAACAPEDIEGQIRVATHSPVPIALGEEWRTIYEALPRFEGRAMAIVQPEMGHTGITEFARMGTLAQAFHVRVMPHATIGCGIFMAASLQASSAQQALVCHEYQHSIFDKNLAYSAGDMACSGGFYTVPTGAGIGVEPKAALFDHIKR